MRDCRKINDADAPLTIQAGAGFPVLRQLFINEDGR